jgi:hypothetical protein
MLVTPRFVLGFNASKSRAHAIRGVIGVNTNDGVPPVPSLPQASTCNRPIFLIIPRRNLCHPEVASPISKIIPDEIPLGRVCLRFSKRFLWEIQAFRVRTTP